jgi:hypothetical protein
MKTLRLGCLFGSAPEICSNIVCELCIRRNPIKSFRLRLMQTLLVLTLVAAAIPAPAQTLSVRLFLCMNSW